MPLRLCWVSESPVDLGEVQVLTRELWRLVQRGGGCRGGFGSDRRARLSPLPLSSRCREGLPLSAHLGLCPPECQPGPERRRAAAGAGAPGGPERHHQHHGALLHGVLRRGRPMSCAGPGQGRGGAGGGHSWAWTVNVTQRLIGLVARIS